MKTTLSTIVFKCSTVRTFTIRSLTTDDGHVSDYKHKHSTKYKLVDKEVSDIFTLSNCLIIIIVSQ